MSGALKFTLDKLVFRAPTDRYYNDEGLWLHRTPTDIKLWPEITIQTGG